MLSMANAKFVALLGTLLLSHFGATNFFKYEKPELRELVERKHAIEPSEPVTGLLVGGSGVHYGLNAKILSRETPYHFLNLALFVEGNGWANYLDFLAGLPMIEHDKIEVVIYSSSDFYALEESREFLINGARRGVLLFDALSWVQKAVATDDPEYGPHSVDRTRIDPETGDMIFPKKICHRAYKVTEMPPPGENLDAIAARAEDLMRLFPNARVFMRPWPVSEQNGPDIEHVYDTLDTGLRSRGVDVLRPPKLMYDTAFACDAPFHPTARGRDMLSNLEAETLLQVLRER